MQFLKERKAAKQQYITNEKVEFPNLMVISNQFVERFVRSIADEGP